MSSNPRVSSNKTGDSEEKSSPVPRGADPQDIPVPSLGEDSVSSVNHRTARCARVCTMVSAHPICIRASQ